VSANGIREAFTNLTLLAAQGLEGPDNPYGVRKEFVEDSTTFWIAFSLSAIVGVMQIIWVVLTLVAFFVYNIGEVNDSAYFIWASLYTTSVAIQTVSFDAMYGGNIFVLALKRLLPQQIGVVLVWLPYLFEYVS
jgi:hypothetical protein